MSDEPAPAARTTQVRKRNRVCPVKVGLVAGDVMADILSQDEVDLLLSAVGEGEAETSVSEPPQPGNTLTAYDFRRPERVSKEQLKGLQSLFEAFSREVSIVIPPFLRTVVRVDLTSIDQLTYDEFILSVARPTSLNIISMAPLEGNGIIELSPALVFPMVDRVLGGKGRGLAEPRELTEIEERIIHRIITMFLECLKRSWDQLIEFRLSLVSQESDPLIVQIVAGSEMVILVGYEIHIGELVGAMNMCIPLVVLTPVLDQISQQASFTRRMTPEMASLTRNTIDRILRKAPVQIDAVLGHAYLPLSDLVRLQPGDVLQLDAPSDGPIVIEVDKTPKFRAMPGRRKESSAVRVTELIRE
ncbi:MAG: flagellar motor switch protein FliM [Candidatus Hydrogenedentes bacterium]|nr:flagellar motor switch protein FliM [Candidatus Hydrogenedentota bacterium]